MEWLPIIIASVSTLIAASSLLFTLWKHLSDKSEDRSKAVEQRVNAIELAMARAIDPTHIRSLEERTSKIEQSLSSISGSNLASRVGALESSSTQHSIDLATLGTSVQSMVSVVNSTNDDIRKIQRFLMEP